MSSRTRLVRLGFPALLVLACPAPDSPRRLHSSIPETAARAAVDGAARSAGASEDWYQKAVTQLALKEYEVSGTALGMQAPNRAQNLRTYFRAGGIEVVPRLSNGTAARKVGASAQPRNEADAWRFTWQMVRWGRSGRLAALSGAVAPRADGSRVRYEHPRLTEWYENGKAGLEQGFTVAARPPGDGPLRLEGRLGGNLRAELRGGSVELLDSRGAQVLRYGELHAWDANGAEVRSHLSLMGDELAILVEDEHSTYPLTVDPLMTTPAWTAESDQAGALFGFSVATAGDVNGDGYSDVIVGAHFYDNGQTDEGRACVYHGSPSGLASSPAWTAEGNQDFSRFGASVASAGDVNNDGYSDVIVGAFGYDDGLSDEGRAYLYLGSASGLTPTSSWTAEGNQAASAFGNSVASAGDVNGDGYSDVIVGAYLYDGGQTDEGRAYVYYGSASGLAASAAWTAESNQTDAHFGGATASAGDVDGDGFSDVIVGAYLYDSGHLNGGAAFVYHGSASGLGLTAVWTAEGNQDNALFGDAVASAGDVNGDGYSDVIVGATFYDNGQGDEGGAFLYVGSGSGLNTVASWVGEGGRADSRYGASVASAGDINGDGYSDVIVGAHMYWFPNEPGRGKAFIYLGSNAGLVAYRPNSGGWPAGSGQDNSFFGVSVAGAGDVNGDGYSDVIVGAHSFDNGQTDEGRAYVYHGSADGIGASASPSWASESDQASAYFGHSVASAGDVNGDGYSDVIVGAFSFDNGEANEGRAFVYCGSASGLALSPVWTAEGNQADAHFGASVASAGDVNGDGYSDVVVGANMYDNGQTDEGRAYVYLGSAGGPAIAPAWTAEGNQGGSRFGRSVASAGDVDGDGYSDVIVGADGFDNGQSDEGRAFVYLGSGDGLALTPAWTAESNQSGAYFGWSVATAGDVNGDGYSDVIVGARDYANLGRAYAYHGSAGGLALAPSWVAESDQAVSWFGYSVASAGDVNGDGYADVIVGAPLYDYLPTANDWGRAYVYRGTNVGLEVSAAWILEDGTWAGSHLGISVASAGDVNGDGYSDIIFGADAADYDRGAAYVLPGGPGGPAFYGGWLFEGFRAGGQAGSGFSYSVACAGDVDGNGYSDVIVGARQYDSGQTDEGRAFVYYTANGRERTPRQVRTDDTAPISLLGRSNSDVAFRLKVTGSTPAGRGRVRMQYEVKPAGTLFNGSGLVSGPFTDTGTPNGGSQVTLSQLVTGLSPDTPYHWRLRLLTDSPTAPRSPWFSPQGNAPTELDLRTGMSSVGVPRGPDEAARLWIESAAPNPFRGVIDLRYSLPARGRVRMAVYDMAGREVALLIDGVEEAGRHTARWEGGDARGVPVRPGMYLARLEFAGRAEAAKIVRVR